MAVEVTRNMDRFMQRVKDRLLEVNKYTGEQFRINAHNTVDQTIYGRQVYNKDGSPRRRRAWELTGNLKSSIGYAVLHNGAVVFESFPEFGMGAVIGAKHAKAVGRNTHGYSLVAVAGMDYAAAVEAKGYDVISGAAEKMEHQHYRAMKKALKKIADEDN